MQIQKPIIKSTTAPDNVEAMWLDVSDLQHPTIRVFTSNGWEEITSDIDIDKLKEEIEADVDAKYSPKIEEINTIATDAKGLATSANNSAASASALAGVAKNLAESAVSVATSANDTAKTANDTATTAKSTADTAKSTADTVNTDFTTFKSGDFKTVSDKATTNATNITSLGNRITTLETFKTQELSADKFAKTFVSESFVAAVTSDGYCIENPDDVKNFSGATVVAILVATPKRKLLIPATSTLKTAYFCNGAQVNTKIPLLNAGAAAATGYLEGYANTANLRETLKETSWAVNVAYTTTLFGKNCYLPSLGELDIILQNKAKIEAHTANTTLKFTTVNEIWSSSLDHRVDDTNEESYLLTMYGGYWKTQGLDGFNVQGLYTVLPVLGLDTANTILYNSGNGQRFLNNAGQYVSINMEENLSYGVSWKPNVADPALTRVGNMSYHKTLPIQSNMRGCIAQMKDTKRIMYYLDSSDWRWREENNARGHVLKDQTLNVGDTYTLTNDVFSTLQYEHQWVKINKIACEVTSIDTTTKTATLNPASTILAGTYDVQLGAVLNGYDGEVMVEVPEFWIKSWDTATKREVRIAPTKIDDTWEHQPRILISAYGDTYLRSVPTNMGYLSTLSQNAALSVCNTHDYCRGGNNNSSYDQYLTTDKCRTMLGKRASQTSRSQMRTNARLSGKEVLSYLQYKRVMYWLWVIEYATFNSQATFNASLTADGYHQGGLGNGVTTVNWAYWGYYIENTPLTPNGYTNEFGNNTDIKSMTMVMPTTSGGDPSSSTTQYVIRWRGIENPFGDAWNNVDGIIINSSSITESGQYYSEVYATDDPSLYSDSDYSKMKMVGIEKNEGGYIKEWALGSTAEIIPRLMGGNATQYKCDNHWVNTGTGLRTLFLGAAAHDGSLAGLGTFYSNYGVGSATANIGSRSSCVIG